MFCSKCGNPVDERAKFCANCGNALQACPPSPVNTAPPHQFWLTVIRADQWFAINPAISITIDGKQEYQIENAATLNIPISAGSHTVYFSCGLRSKLVEVNITQNQVLNLKWSRATGSLVVK